jgi:hypothetical protein
MHIANWRGVNLVLQVLTLEFLPAMNRSRIRLRSKSANVSKMLNIMRPLEILEFIADTIAKGFKLA